MSMIPRQPEIATLQRSRRAGQTGHVAASLFGLAMLATAAGLFSPPPRERDVTRAHLAAASSGGFRAALDEAEARGATPRAVVALSASRHAPEAALVEPTPTLAVADAADAARWERAHIVDRTYDDLLSHWLAAPEPEAR